MKLKFRMLNIILLKHRFFTEGLPKDAFVFFSVSLKAMLELLALCPIWTRFGISG